ncbi:MAG: polysaccharide deacetylase, partial [Firmicutes bacterium]|nr:polysaccharide deacetylase [Bacillota bacterium]
MKRRTMVVALILIIGVSLTAAFFYKDFLKNQPVREYHTNITLDDLYNADEEVPNLLKCNDTKYTDQLLQVAKACGFKNVVQSDVVLDVRQSNAAATDADALVAALRPGSIVSVKLLANIELIRNEPGKTDLKPAIDKQPGIVEMSQDGLREPEIALVVEKLLIALQKAQYSTVYVEDYSKISSKTALWPDYSNNFAWVTKTASFLQEQIMALFSCPIAYAAEGIEQPATEIKTVYTTEQALSYTFG